MMSAQGAWGSTAWSSARDRSENPMERPAASADQVSALAERLSSASPSSRTTSWMTIACGEVCSAACFCCVVSRCSDRAPAALAGGSVTVSPRLLAARLELAAMRRVLELAVHQHREVPQTLGPSRRAGRATGEHAAVSVGDAVHEAVIVDGRCRRTHPGQNPVDHPQHVNVVHLCKPGGN